MAMRVEENKAEVSTPAAAQAPAPAAQPAPAEKAQANSPLFTDGFDRPSGKGPVALNAEPPAAAVSSAEAGEDPGYNAAAVARVYGSAAYQAMSDEDKGKVDTVVSTAGYRGVGALADVMESDPGRLYDRDANGTTTLDNLVRLATQPLNEQIQNDPIGFGHQEILDDVLTDVAHPEQIDQGGYNTCEITDMQHALAQRNPAEYARLMAGLTGPEGQVQMRGGGTLKLHPDYTGRWNPNDRRSASEALFQTSVMEKVTGSYHPRGDYNVLFGVKNYSGNSTWSARQTMGQMFGTNYGVNGVSDIEVALDPLKRLGTGAALAELERFDNSKGPVIADLVLDGMETSHSVEVLKVEDGRVYFRNPWGPNNLHPGQSGQLEDGAQSIYSMSVDEFASRTQAFMRPEEPAEAPLPPQGA